MTALPSLRAFRDELEKIGFGLETVTGLVGGFRTGRAAAGHAAAKTAPHGSKTRAEDVARRIAIVTAPVGAIAGLALARKHRLADKAVALLAKKAPRGLVADPTVEQHLLHSLAVPALAGLAGGTVAGYGTGKAVGLKARLANPNRGPKEE